MVWSQVGALANVVLTVAYIAIAHSILWPLARAGQLWKNVLGLMTGLIFFSCGVGHAIHAEHTLRLVLTGGWGAADIDWHLGLWDSLTAVTAIAYWRLRQLEGPPEDTGTLFEDLERRQREAEARAEEAVLSMSRHPRAHLGSRPARPPRQGGSHRPRARLSSPDRRALT